MHLTPTLSSPDVLIVGGGIIGASIAWRLAQSGHSVTLIDSRQLGQEASYAGAGMLVPGSEYDEPSAALSFAMRSLGLYPAFTAELGEEAQQRIEFAVCGSLELAADEREFESLIVRAGKQRALGIESETIEGSELGSRIPGIAPQLGGAIYYPHEGQVDPRTVMAALRVALVKRGVTILENTCVQGVDIQNRSVVAKLANGDSVHAARAVIAAGAWTTALGIPDIPKAFPVRGHLIGYDLPPATLPHVLRFHHTYVVQRTTGYTIAGTSEEHAGFAREVDPVVAADIAARAAALFLRLPAMPRDVWTGFRPGIETGEPQIGRWRDTPLWLAYGHYRNGILLAPATAEVIATQLAGY